MVLRLGFPVTSNIRVEVVVWMVSGCLRHYVQEGSHKDRSTKICAWQRQLAQLLLCVCQYYEQKRVLYIHTTSLYNMKPNILVENVWSFTSGRTSSRNMMRLDISVTDGAWWQRSGQGGVGGSSLLLYSREEFIAITFTTWVRLHKS